ncbi:MAG: hypothetical protein HY017_11545 [Betaproteobacteria bacterium]|nr:hypothetical protein [Betaproteobacteria bacterium]
MPLHEQSVKEALEALSWEKLKVELDTVQFDAAVAEELSGFVLRSTGLLLKRPNPSRASARRWLFQNIADYAANRRGPDCAGKLRATFDTIELIDRGYHGILDMLERCDVSKLPPEVRASACIDRTAIEYAEVIKRAHDAVLSLPELFDAQNTVLQGEDGVTFTPDGAVNMLVETLTMTLVMESYRNGWVAKDDDRVILPAWRDVDDQHRYMAGSTGILAAFWRVWQRIEERRRYFGGSLKEYVPPSRPPNFPPGFPEDSTVTVLEPDMEWEAVDFVANERLNSILFQNYMHLIHATNAKDTEVGIEGQAALLPNAYVCLAEAHAGAALSELLGFAIHEDQQRYAGLRLVEWLRGFAILQCMADKAWDPSSDTPKSLIQFTKRAELAARLGRLGLAPEPALEFIRRATLRRSSRDLFDCPLIGVGEDDLIVFGPAVRSSNLTRVVLSAFSSLGARVNRKGPSFERTLRELIEKQGLTCKAFKATRDGKEYEYDAVVPWGKYLFLLECKSHSLSNWSPVASYYFQLETRSHILQVNRLAEALLRYPDILESHFGVDAKGKQIVPCVVNAMPFSVPGAVDGVYFTDMSALTRFFEARHLRLIQPHNLGGGRRLLHRVALRSLWSGDKPSPEDLLKHLDDPVQVKMISERLAIEAQWTKLNDRVAAVHPRLVLQPDTFDAAVARFGADPKSVRKEMDLLDAAIAKRRLKKKEK